MTESKAQIVAGFAEKNASLFRRLGIALGDPAVVLNLQGSAHAIVRDLEMDRVRQVFGGDVTCPADHAPANGLSADRETATAQAAAQLLIKQGVDTITGDRTLPLIYASHLRDAGITVEYDSDLGVTDRRGKTDQEIEWLAESQAVTEDVMRRLLETIASTKADRQGVLQHDGQALTSQVVRSMAAVEFLKRGYTMSHGAIVATAPEVADCHHAGVGPLRTEVPVIVDLFPRCEATRYWGDCTRTIVHGQPSDTVQLMWEAVTRAKDASTACLVTGTTADEAHRASEQVLVDAGYPISRGEISEGPSIQHGTGHGIGLELHEPILLDTGGPAMVENEVLTVEPGLYGRVDGGVRVEDMIVVTKDGPKNLNRLPSGLDWKCS